MLKFIKRNVYVIAPFLVSFVIMTIAFANQGLFPFGNNQIMIIDSWHQYYPFLQELQHKLTQGGSLFYSWNSGLGSNFFINMAYYAMSPIYILSILFPKEYLREFMMLATILKISFGGMFFAIYLKKVFQKQDVSIAVFGLMYAFCGFVMGYYWDIMWLDGVALLPLIILGIHKVLDEEGSIFYIVTLAIAMISNFYIGYILCEFILIYFFILYFTKYPWRSFGHFIKKIMEIGISSAIGLGISAVVLIPVYKGLQLTYVDSIAGPKILTTYLPFLDLFNNLLPNVPVTVKSGLPNMYCGLFAVLLLIFYFLTTSISVKTKVLNFLLLIFFIFSFNINGLNYIWHGFSFPNEVPYRFSFIFSFLVLTLAYQAFLRLEEISVRTVWKILGIFGVYLIVYQKSYNEDYVNQVFYISLLFLTLYGGTLLLLKYKTIPKGVFTGLICCIILGEVMLSALNGTNTAGNTGRSDYPIQNAAVQKALTTLNETDDSFYRLEMIKWYSTNDPILYGYRGVSEFSSTINSKITTYAQKIGLAASPESNRYLYASSTPIVNALLSIKYLIGTKDTGKVPNASYEAMDQEGDVTVYRNKYYLPIGFMVKDSIKDWDIKSSNPFDVQEGFLSHATTMNEKVFTLVKETNKSYVNMTIGSEYGNRSNYKNGNSSQVGSAKITFTAEKTAQMYLYMSANNTDQIEVLLDKKSNKYDSRRGQIVDLGIVTEGTSFDVSFEVKAADGGYYVLKVVTFDEELFASAYRELSDEIFTVSDFSDTRIEGTIEAKQDGSLFMSIPYEKGWQAKVDGKITKIIPIENAMISLPITEGYHKVELHYTVNGFKIGLIISSSSIVLLLIYYFYLRKKTKHTQGDYQID